MSNVDLSLLTVRRTLLGAITTTLSCSLLLNFLDYLRELLLRPFQLSGKPIQWICHLRRIGYGILHFALLNRRTAHPAVRACLPAVTIKP